MNAVEFIQQLVSELSPLVHSERFADVRFEQGFTRGGATIWVKFYNLPADRAKKGGAEAMNNRQIISVRGFSDDENTSVSKVQAEQIVNGIYRENRNIEGISKCPNMRKKTGEPSKVASYVASYINTIASEYAPVLQDY